MSRECILCNSGSVFPLEFQNNRKYLKCGNCDLIFVPENLHLSVENEAARYRLHENSLSNEGYAGMFLEKISLIGAHCGGVHSVLDYGCGPEPVLALLMKKEGFDCDFYDPIFFPLFPERSFDLVISTEVFEHFRDVRTEIENIRSILAPSGFLAVMTSFHDTIQDFGKWWYRTDPTHICFFSWRTFEWIAYKFGFEIIYRNKKNFIILKLGS
ncbi:MAG: class I SAM-dependent methyltransferase [Candidatus Methanoperedens sp.]|nr:class I SAM-dependent methyltransferase [Candidatus Methanoperedens sp.]